MINVTETIKHILIDKKMRMGDLAQQLNKTPSALSLKLSRNTFKISQLMEIADALGCQVSAYFVDYNTGQQYELKNGLNDVLNQKDISVSNFSKSIEKSPQCMKRRIQRNVFTMSQLSLIAESLNCYLEIKFYNTETKKTYVTNSFVLKRE